MGAKDFQDVTEMTDLIEWFERSRTEDVVLFLHDYWCPISSHAYNEMTQVQGEIALIDVAASGHITAAIQERTGIKHQSPQVLILRNERALWDASHYGITASAVSEAIRKS